MSDMTIAIYKAGVLHPLTPLDLPEDTRVQLQIEPVEQPEESVLQSLAKLATDLGVDDLAEQHDHYLYGLDKQ